MRVRAASGMRPAGNNPREWADAADTDEWREEREKERAPNEEPEAKRTHA